MMPLVCVVDDEHAVRQSLGRLLKSAGFHARTFASAREYLDAGAHPGPCCLILDVNMPDLDGIHLQEELGGRSESIVFLTGCADVPIAVSHIMEACTPLRMRFQPKTQQVEPVFMTSRDGVVFRRWSEELIPITAPKDRDGNRSNYMTWGLLQLPGQDRELSVYATEAYYAGPGSRVRRFTFRTDGFVSLHAEAEGTLVTKPLTFTGAKLSLNIASRGPTRVELQDAGGKPLPGFALDDCTAIVGDQIGQTVVWKGGSLSALAGQPVRLRFVLREADLYSFQFTS